MNTGNWLQRLHGKKFIEVWDVLGIDIPDIEDLCAVEREALRHPLLLEAEQQGILKRRVVTFREPPVYWTWE